MHAPTALPRTIDDLRQGLTGSILTDEHPDYDRARRGFYASHDRRRPAALVQPATTDEVARVVGLAGDRGLDLAVRGGGHSLAGHSTVDGGLVLDLSRLRELTVDTAARSAWAQTGMTAGEVTTATAAHGLSVGFGDTGSVGIAGITLGGGIGFLSRAHGLTIDHLLGAEVVTADGRIRHVDADHDPELFWAIRGGGGNFGVATRLHYRLREVGTVHGGLLVLPSSPEVVADLVAAAESAPETVTMIANVMSAAPPMPFLPDHVHGRPAVVALLVHAGPEAAADAALAPFRAVVDPLHDDLRRQPYTALYAEEEGEAAFRPHAVVRNVFRDRFTRADAAVVLDRLGEATSPMAVVQLRVLGGAIGDAEDTATAYAHRGRRLMVNIGAMFMDPDGRDEHTAWADTSLAALRQDGVDGAYVNFVGDDGPDRLEEVYPGPTLTRLRAAKRRFDPDNLFRHNVNIPA